MMTPLHADICKLAADVPGLRPILVPLLREARRTVELIRVKYVNLGDFGGSDPVVDSWDLSVKGPYESMQELMPLLKKYKFRWDPRSHMWSIRATNYAYSNRRRQNFWNAARRNQEAAYPLIMARVKEINEAAKAHNESVTPKVDSARALAKMVGRVERLNNRMKTYGIEVKHVFPGRYDMDEAKVWIFGDTYRVKNVMKKYGFRWGSGRDGKGWWIADVEFRAVADQWYSDLIRAMPAPAAFADSPGTAVFSEMSPRDLVKWLRPVVEADLEAHEWYDGEVTPAEVMRGFQHKLLRMKPHEQQAFYDKWESTGRLAAQKVAVPGSKTLWTSPLKPLRFVAEDQTQWSGHIASGNQGPLTEVLTKYWNNFHDMDYDMGQVLHLYDGVASYRGGPGQRAAEKLMAEIKRGIDALQSLADNRGVLDRLVSAEREFIKHFGHPEDYVVSQRNQMFPRSAMVAGTGRDE